MEKNKLLKKGFVDIGITSQEVYLQTKYCLVHMYYEVTSANSV